MAGVEGVNRQLTILERAVEKIDPNTAKQRYESLLLDDSIADLTPEEYEALEPRIDRLGERIAQKISDLMMGTQQAPGQPRAEQAPPQLAPEQQAQQIDQAIQAAEDLIPKLSADLTQDNFDPDQPNYDGSDTPVMFFYKVKRNLVVAINILERGGTFDQVARATQIREDLLVRIENAEKALQSKVFEKRKTTVETNHPIFVALLNTTTQLRAEIASATPDFSRIATAEAQLQQAKQECDTDFSGAFKTYLESKYINPTQSAIDELKRKRADATEQARLTTERNNWLAQPEVMALIGALDPIINAARNNIDDARVAALNYATAATTLRNINTTHGNALAILTDSTTNDKIKSKQTLLTKLVELSGNKLSVRIDEVGLAEWNAEPEITLLRVEIDRVRGINIDTQVQPNCVGGGPCYDLAALTVGTAGAIGFQSRLNAAKTAATNAGLLNKNGIYQPSNQTKNAIEAIVVELSEADEHLSKCIEKARQAAERLVDTNDVRARIDYLWDQIAAAEKNEQGNQNVYEWIHNPYVPGKHIREAGLIPLVEEFLPPIEQERWKLMIKLHNAFWAALSGSGSNQDPFAQMYYKIALESRSGAAGYIDFPELKKFARLVEVRPLVDKIKEIYAGVGGSGVYRYTNNGRVYEHDFGKNGNPNSAQVADGYLSLSELLQREFLDTSSSMIKAVIYWSMLSEGRLHYYRKYYANYLKTAEGSFDTSIIALHSPLATLLYKIRGYGVIPADLMLLWQVLRLPGNSGIFTNQVGAASKVNRDRDLRRRRPKLATRPTGQPLYGEITYTGQPVLVEHQPIPTDDTDKSRSFTSCRNDQVVEAIEVRSLRDMALTKYDDRFAGVPVDDDLTIIPTPWELINDAAGQYGPISFADYNLCLNAWKEFIKVAQSPASISRIEDVNDRISTLVGKIAPFKGFLAMMPRNTRKGETFRLLLQQVLLRATKQLYDDYATKVNYPLKDRVGRPLTKKMYFLNVAISTYRGLGTADPDLAEFMVAELTKELSAGNTVFTGLFDDTRQDITSFIYAGMDGRRREALLEKYSKEEPPDAKGK